MLLECLIHRVGDGAVPGWPVSRNERVGIEVAERVERTDHVVRVMGKVGRQQTWTYSVERGMGGDHRVTAEQHADLGEIEAAVPRRVAVGCDRHRTSRQIQPSGVREGKRVVQMIECAGVIGMGVGE